MAGQTTLADLIGSIQAQRARNGVNPTVTNNYSGGDPVGLNRNSFITQGLANGLAGFLGGNARQENFSGPFTLNTPYQYFGNTGVDLAQVANRLTGGEDPNSALASIRQEIQREQDWRPGAEQQQAQFNARREDPNELARRAAMYAQQGQQIQQMGANNWMQQQQQQRNNNQQQDMSRYGSLMSQMTPPGGSFFGGNPQLMQQLMSRLGGGQPGGNALQFGADHNYQSAGSRPGSSPQFGMGMFGGGYGDGFANSQMPGGLYGSSPFGNGASGGMESGGYAGMGGMNILRNQGINPMQFMNQNPGLFDMRNMMGGGMGNPFAGMNLGNSNWGGQTPPYVGGMGGMFGSPMQMNSMQQMNNMRGQYNPSMMMPQSSGFGGAGRQATNDIYRMPSGSRGGGL